MKTVFSKLLAIIMLVAPVCVPAQGDAFFYENYDRANRDGSTGFSFDNFNNGEGFAFGNFNDNLNGLGFGNFSLNEGGFGFGNFGGDGDGFNFGVFDFEGGDVPPGDGILLLCGLAMIRLRKKEDT